MRSKMTLVRTTINVFAISALLVSGFFMAAGRASADAAPVITLLGTNPISVEYGSVYTDAGATALDDVDGDLTLSIVTTGTVNTSVIGTYDIHYNVSDSSANPAIEVIRTVYVIAKELTVTGITADDKLYDGTTDVNLVGSGTLVGVVGADLVTLTGTPTGTFLEKHVGIGKPVSVSGLALTGADIANYSLTSPTPTANISLRPITVTGNTDSKVYDGTTDSSVFPALTSGTLGAGDSGSFIQAFDTKHVGTGKMLIPSGTVTDSGSLDVTSDYDITFLPDTTGEITPLAITVTAVANTKIYNGLLDAVSTPLLSLGTPLALGDVSFFTETYDTKDVGTGHVLTPGGVIFDSTITDVTSDYTITFNTVSTGVITSFNLTILGAVANNKIYDSTTPTTVDFSGAFLLGVFAPDVVTFDSSAYTAAFNNKNVGFGKPVTVLGLVLTGADMANYTLSQPSPTADITPRALTVTAVTNTKVYNGTTSAAGIPTVTSGTILGGDTANFTETYDTADVGTGKTLTPSGTVTDGNSGNNYSYSFVTDTTGVITKASSTTVVTCPISVVYNGLAQTPCTALVTGAGGFSTSIPVGYANNTNVGTATTSAVFLGGPNHNGSSDSSATFAITPAPLTVTADPQTKVYGAADPSFTYTHGALIAPDTDAVFSGSLSRLPGGNAGTHAITLGTLSAGSHYSIVFVPANLTITPRPLTVTAATNTKVYNATTSAAATPTITSGVLQGSDTAHFTETYATKDVATGKTLTPAGTVTDGNSGNNYSYTFVADTTGVITQAPLTITAEDKTKVYGTVNPTLTANYTGFLGTDTSADLDTPVSLNTTAVQFSVVGTYPITPSAAADVNYSITFAPGTLTVTTASNLDFSGILDNTTDPAHPTVTLPADINTQNDVNGTTFTVSIPNGTVITGDTGWDGNLALPTGVPSSGTLPSGFQFAGNVIEVGSAGHVLFFDHPVLITITNVASQISYRAAGSSTWVNVSTCVGTYAAPVMPTTPGDCSITDFFNTKIYTFHFSKFTNLTVTPGSGSGGGGGGGGGFIPLPTPTPTPTPSPVVTPPPAAGQVLGTITFSNGTLVKTANSGTVYLVENGKLRPFATAAIFRARGHKFSNIQIISADLVTAGNLGRPVGYPDGTLIRGSGPTLFRVSGDAKVGIPSMAVFRKLKLSLNKVVRLSDAELATYDDGGVAK